MQIGLLKDGKYDEVYPYATSVRWNSNPRNGEADHRLRVTGVGSRARQSRSKAISSGLSIYSLPIWKHSRSSASCT